jgi:metal-responsive CopG/Arc/MetJ family transcriptional regulator
MNGIAERVGVSLPKSVIERLEKARKHLQINRSKFFLLALLSYLDRIIEDDDRRLQKIYREIEEIDKELLAHFSDSYKNLPGYAG